MNTRLQETAVETAGSCSSGCAPDERALRAAIVEAPLANVPGAKGSAPNAVDLIGADLDLAVAMAGEEWKTAHELWPTMTLDPTFSGARIIDLHNGRYCYLQPRNSFRQDPQAYSPSTDWALGGRIIEREQIRLNVDDSGAWWAEMRLQADGSKGFATSFHRAVAAKGATPLIAAMRCFVIAKATGEAA